MKFALRNAVFAAILALGSPAIAEESDFDRVGEPYLRKYCVGCHSGDDPEGGLTLESYQDVPSVIRGRDEWDAVLTRIQNGEMPPKGEPRPSVAESDALVQFVKRTFDEYDRTAEPDPGRVTMRRLNRTEYRNTIRDLVGVDFDPAADFPSDDIGHGFDNVGDVLTMSPVLMERYLDAAEQVMAAAIMPEPPPVIKRHLASTYTEPASSESGGLIVDGFRPMRTDGTRPIDLGPINTPYNWEAEGEYVFRTRVFGERSDGKPVRASILVAGESIDGATPDAELDKFAGNVPRPARLLKTFDVVAKSRDEATVLEVVVPPMPGRKRMLVAIEKPREGEPPSVLWIEYLALDGPLDPRPASHRALLRSAGETEAERTREALGRFLRRAWRRPPTAEELERSAELVRQVAAESGNWERGMQFAMQAALCSPKFLFRAELDEAADAAEPRDLDEFQLASRLSYFLWASMPDDVLLDLAEQGGLRANLDEQITRMLADPRAESLTQNFAMQWLQLQRIEFISPDGTLFPTFDADLRRAMVRETELFFDSVVREDRSLLDLIDADYTYLNEVLARHYGIADANGNLVGQPPHAEPGAPIRGQEFVRVRLSDRNRGGLLTQASVLTATSNPTRTSPVKRGRWTLEQILGAPPPPPPADVPELPESGEDASVASLRERLEIHRRDPACANCHARMDPIGFALENYDAVGAWRTQDGSFEIDAAGEFPDGTRFEGPAELKSLILDRKEEFIRCIAQKMLIYSLGRGLEYYDRPALERIVRQVAEQDFRFSSLVRAIVASEPFLRRRGL